MKQKPTTKTSTPVVDKVAEVQKVDPVAERLDRIIELLVKIEKNTQRLPQPGIDFSRFVKD